MSSRIDGILFDLDDTLLDHSGAAEHAFTHWAHNESIDPSLINQRLWREAERRYPPEPHNGISMSFTRICRMRHFLVNAVPERLMPGDEELVEKYESYLASYAGGWRLYTDTFDCLSRLRARFRVGILTNGAALMQRQKIQTRGLGTRVDLIVISEEIGYAKPAPESFKIACDRLGIVPGHVLYIGDDPRIDIDGATNAGLHTALLVRNTSPGEAAPEDLTSRILTQ